MKNIFVAGMILFWGLASGRGPRPMERIIPLPVRRQRLFPLPNTLIKGSGHAGTHLPRGPYASEVDAIINELNRRGSRWCADHNSMMRLSPEERRRRLGAVVIGENTGPMLEEEGSVSDLPAVLDWRNNNGVNAVSPIKDQGHCGSCWAFSTTAGLESQMLMRGLSPANQSEQILVSCSGAGSCDGGGIYKAADYIRDTGLPPESYFPYAAADKPCANAEANWQQATAKIAKWSSVPHTVAAIKKALAAYGPLPTAFHVYSDFMAYSGGVYSYTTGKLEGGHGVEIVGYDDNDQAFIVKNSWGTGWGEKGFFRIAYSEVTGKTNFGLDTVAFSSP